MKSFVEGSLLSNSQNIRFYVTSNLRHISDDQDFFENENELFKKRNEINLISLSDRFALWIGFYDNNKEKYIKTVKYYLKIFKKREQKFNQKSYGMVN